MFFQVKVMKQHGQNQVIFHCSSVDKVELGINMNNALCVPLNGYFILLRHAQNEQLGQGEDYRKQAGNFRLVRWCILLVLGIYIDIALCGYPSQIS